MTVDDILRSAMSNGKPLRSFHKGMVVKGGGSMGLIRDYSYVLEEEPGTNFEERFKPVFTPAEMLFMGVFEGKYLNDCTDEFPQEWFLNAGAAGRLSPEGRNVERCNYFGVDSRQPLSVWKEKGWGPKRGRHVSENKGRAILADCKKNPDERGWFQW